MPEPLSDRESYENSYYYFVQAVRALAAPVSDQGRIYGGSTGPGVAWELKYDVAAGSYLFNCVNCNLSLFQREEIQALIEQLDNVPKGADLHHEAWGELRPQALRLLDLLQPITQSNIAYLGIAPE